MMACQERVELVVALVEARKAHDLAASDWFHWQLKGHVGTCPACQAEIRELNWHKEEEASGRR